MPTGPIRILVADDFPDSAESFAALLIAEGFEVHFARDGHDAFQQALIWKPQICILNGAPLQNRDSQAIQVKLDEIIRSIEGAHLALLDLEELEEGELNRICKDYRELATQARKDIRAGKSDTDVREVGSAHRKEMREKHRRRKNAGS